jgi:hypothetical protein
MGRLQLPHAARLGISMTTEMAGSDGIWFVAPFPLLMAAKRSMYALCGHHLSISFRCSLDGFSPEKQFYDGRIHHFGLRSYGFGAFFAEISLALGRSVRK